MVTETDRGEVSPNRLRSRLPRGTMSAMSDPSAPELRYGPTPQTPQTPQTPGRRRGPAALWPVGVLVAAVVVAVLVGALTFHAVRADSEGEAWAELGALLWSWAVGGLAFVASYVIGLVLAARTVFATGGRVAPVSAALVLPLLIVGLVGMAALLTPVPLGWPVYLVAALAGVGVGPAAFAWAGSRTGRRRLAVTTGVVLVCVAAGAVGSAARASLEVDRVASKLPLVLFDGRSAEAPFNGWRRDVFSATQITDGAGPFSGGDQIYLKYFTDAGVVFVTMHSHAGACGNTEGYTCEVIGDLDGNELRHYERTAGYGYYPRAAQIEAVVYPDGTAVSIQGPDTSSRSAAPGSLAPSQVVAQLRRVKRDAFESATGAPLRKR